MSEAIPALPPISNVQDPAVRAYLQALTTAWQVRNGNLGSGDEKFLTVKDLQDGFKLAGGSSVSAFRTGGANNLVAVTVANAVKESQRGYDLSESPLYKKLSGQIATIEMPEWFRGKFGAEIKTEQIKTEDAISAVANETTTAITNIDSNVAIAQQMIEATSTQAGSAAQAVTSLQAGLGYNAANGTYASVIKAEQAFNVANSVSGTVSGAWSVKFDANGYVAGAGLGIEGKGGNYTSEFGVLATRFFIKDPASTSTVAPFVFQGNRLKVNGYVSAVGVTTTDANMTVTVGDYNNNGTVDGVIVTQTGGSRSYLIKAAATSVSLAAGYFLGATGSGVYGLTSNASMGALWGQGPSARGYVGYGSSAFYAHTGTYDPFTGSHEGLIAKSITPEVGDILCDAELVNKACVSNTIFIATLSTVQNQSSIGVYTTRKPVSYGVAALAGFDITTLTDYDIAGINAVGEGQINVCGEGGDLSPGDLIVTSNMIGKGMKQADDIIRSYTVAKCREAVTFSSPSEVKQVACIYLCG